MPSLFLMHLCACYVRRVRSPPASVTDDAEAQAAAADLLRALASPHRVAIVLALAGGERCVHELVEALDVSQPLVSQHLRVLRSERLVSARRRGREMAYALTDDHVAHIVADAMTHANERTSR